MTNPHPFSPITTEENFIAALRCITEQSVLLALQVLGQKQTLHIDTLTIFAQSDREYDFISKTVRRYGEVSPFTHGETLYISSNFSVGEHTIKFLGVRKPDDSRKEVGYGDYPVDNYSELVRELSGNEFTSEITSGRNQHLIELKHPDFDVRGYIVPAELHDDGVVRADVKNL